MQDTELTYKNSFFLKICEIGCAILIIYFLWYVEAFGNNSLLVTAAFLATMGSFICYLLFECEGKLELSMIPNGIWVNLAMVFYCLITGFLVAYNIDDLLYYVKEYLIYTLIAATICYISNEKQSVNWVLNIIKIATLICCIHLMFFGYHYDSQRIVLSSNNNPNIMGIILVIGIFAFAYSSGRSIIRIIADSGFIALLFYNVIMTGSRKSFISALVIILVFGISLIRDIRREGTTIKSIVVILLAIIGVLLVLHFYNSFFQETAVFSRLQTMGDEESNGSRIEMYLQAIQIFWDKPFLGGGLHQFGYWSGRGGYSHSTYAEAISCFGFIGCLIYFAPIIQTTFRYCRFNYYVKNDFKMQLGLGLCLIELFLGLGTIFFYDMYHFIAWSLIYTIYDIKIKEYKDEEAYLLA